MATVESESVADDPSISQESPRTEVRHWCRTGGVVESEGL